MLLVAAVALAQVNYSRELEQRAENGDARAMFELSQCYRYGKGVEKSMRLANQWVIRAAEAGNTQAISFCEEMGLPFTPQAPAVATSTRPATYTVRGVSFTMIPVEGGTFTMGATAEQGSDARDNEKPAHQVTLSSYSIGQTEVTQELWQAVMGSNPSEFKGNNLPVEQVSWDDCQTFISKLNQLTGQNFRLPTEAEWEYAARGGNRSKGYKYAGSNSLNDVAWFWQNSGDSYLTGEWDWNSIKSNNCKTHPVATKWPNELGLFDMSGNVGELCQDWVGSYSTTSQTNPTGPASGSNRVHRGGCWYGIARGCRVSYRYYFTPSNTGNFLGLRLAL